MAGVKCKAKRDNGEPCEAWAGEDGYCFAHSPGRAAERATARKAGGLNRQTPHKGEYSGPRQVRTLGDVLQVLDYVFAESLALENSIARGRLLVALAAGYADAIKDGSLEERITRLEEAQNGKPR